MKKHLAFLATAAFFGLLPSASQAACVATGSIPQVVINAASPAIIDLRANTAATPTYRFVTTNAGIAGAAALAESAHMTVRITGDASACGAVVGGVSAGGNLVSIVVAP